MYRAYHRKRPEISKGQNAICYRCPSFIRRIYKYKILNTSKSLDKNKISSTSAIAQTVYKTLLRAARKKGGDWLQRIKGDSLFQSKDSNVFKNNLVQNTMFSFANENDPSVANKSISFKQTQELTELSDDDEPVPERDSIPLRHSMEFTQSGASLSMEQLEKSPIKPAETEANNWSIDLGQVYKNPHFKQERVLRPLDEFKPLDFQSFKYRDQSPPIREADSAQYSTRESQKDGKKDELSMNKYLRDYGSGTYDSASTKFDDIAGLIREDDLRKRKPIGTGFLTNTTTERDKSLNTSNKIYIDEPEDLEDLLFKDKVKPPNVPKNPLNQYFDALRINTLRQKRVEGKAYFME